MRHEPSRRTVLGGLGLAAGLAVAGPARRAYCANETIGIGVIGCGGRSRAALMPALKKIPGVRFVAVCDVYEEHLKAGQYVAGGSEIFATVDHQELLARRDVDAVIIGSPDHLHVPQTIDACNAGKDVYVEKPFTHDLKEGAAAIEAQDRTQRIVQIGTQQRSMTHLIEAKKLIETGVLGPVRKIQMTWNRNLLPLRKHPYNIKPQQVDWKRFLGNAPDQPFDAHKMRNWRWFWDFGGGIFTDLMVHWYDTVDWMLDLGTPATAASIGNHFAAEGIWETPDTVQTLLSFPKKGTQLHFEGTFVNQHGKAYTAIMGEQATLYLDRGRFELIPEPNRNVEPRQMILGSGERGSDFFDQPDGELLHLTEWIEAIRSRRKPNCPAEAGVRSAAAAHLANIALREERVAKGSES